MRLRREAHHQLRKASTFIALAESGNCHEPSKGSPIQLDRPHLSYILSVPKQGALGAFFVLVDKASSYRVLFSRSTVDQ